MQEQVPMIDLQRAYRRAADVRQRTIDTEAVVVRQQAAEVVVLNEVGGRILELLDGQRTLAEVVDVLVVEFEVERAVLEADAVAFVGEVVEAGVVEE